MLKNTYNKELKTMGLVLRRTNYGEADRILNIITPFGKVSAMARGVRKEKSKLAGGVELLTLSDYVIHFGKSEIGVVTSVRMVKYYGELLKKYDLMEYVAMILKKINQASENSDSGDFFGITKQCLTALESGMQPEVVEAWFTLNLKRAMGEQVNVYRDVAGEKLVSTEQYVWDSMERGFSKNERGEFGANEIKLMRLMLTTDLNVIGRVKTDGMTLPRVCGLCKMNNANVL